MAQHGHTPPIHVYYLIFATLLLLTLVTVEVAFTNLGFLSFWVAIGIATTKAALVLLYFMHVRYSDPLTWVFAAAGFLWLIILFVHTFSDYWTRGWLPSPESWM